MMKARPELPVGARGLDNEYEREWCGGRGGLGRNGVDENGLRQSFGTRCRLLNRSEVTTTGICPAISGTPFSPC